MIKIKVFVHIPAPFICSFVSISPIFFSAILYFFGSSLWNNRATFHHWPKLRQLTSANFVDNFEYNDASTKFQLGSYGKYQHYIIMFPWSNACAHNHIIHLKWQSNMKKSASVILSESTEANWVTIGQKFAEETRENHYGITWKGSGNDCANIFKEGRD